MAQKTYTLITGASSGIGAGLAAEAARDGRHLIIVSRQRTVLEETGRTLEAQYGIEVIALAQDLSLPGAAAEVYAEVRRRGLTVDVLINNAGLGLYGEFRTNDPQQLHAMLVVNMVALTELTRLFLPDLLALSEAAILNVASVTGFLPGPFMSAYFATKHYVLAFSEGLWEELRDTSVSVTCLCPPPVRTSFAQRAHIANSSYMATTKVTPEAVAQVGYQAMRRGQAVVVPTLRYFILTTFLVRITPRFVLRRLLYYLNTPSRQAKR